MAPSSTKAMLLFLVLMLPAFSFAQNPYSDAAFRTFISVSADGTVVTAKLTFLNITYFRQIDEAKIAEIQKKVAQTQNLQDLYTEGDYSSDSFTAEMLPVNNSPIGFTFEGQTVLDASGNEICTPSKTRTDEKGMASCDIKYYKDSVNGAKRNIEDYKSCGYATVKSEAQGDLPSASQATTVCPDNVAAVSAFAPAITSEIGSNLPFCFPAMLIAGLLVAAMYYAGRDPLSLFDLTTPKLPKTPSFKVKMAQSPQMLRQVQRRYMMIKKQARRDSVREIARFARKSGMNAAEAKREMNALYNEMEAKMKNKLSADETLALRSSWAALMEKYKPGAENERMRLRFERSLEFSSGLHMAYLQSHQAWAAMNEARGKTGKGGLWRQYVSNPVIGKLTDASVDFENSRVGKVLGRIPFVKRAVAAPSKVLDVTTQMRGSRTALKAVRSEMLGQMATMLGRTWVGKPVYNAFRSVHVKGDGKQQTGFGKAYTFLTGRDWRTFEDKHDLTKKRLVEFYDLVASMRQNAIDAHNWTFDQIAAKLIYALPMRANAMQQEDVKKIMAAMGVKPEDISRLGNSTALDALFAQLRENMKGSAKGKELVDELEKAMKTGAIKEDDKRNLEKSLKAIQGIISGLGGADRVNADNMLAQLKKSIAIERELSDILKGKCTDQSSILDSLVHLADRHSNDDIRHIKEAVKEFRAVEKTFRENMLVYLNDRNYYQIVEKRHLESDLASGMSERKLVEKYGANIVALTADHELFRQMLGIREASTGEKLKRALDSFMASIGMASLSADERKMLSQIAADYGGKKELTPAQKARISAMMDAMDTLRLTVDGRVFGKFNKAEAEMKTWMLDGANTTGLFNSYSSIARIFSDRLEARIAAGEKLEIHDIAREGSAFGKNPLELVIEKALADAIVAKATASKAMSEADARVLANEMLSFMREKNGKMKDMDSLEQFFKKGTGGEAYTKEFADFLRRVSPDGTLTSETLFKSAMVRVNDFAREWSARNYAAIEMLHGGEKAGKYMASYANATADLLAFSKVRTTMAYVGGEKEFYRQEAGYSDYRKFGLESAIYTARTWEKLFGFIVSKDWGGTSRGEQVLHQMSSARTDYLAALERYQALYRNLRSSESVFYDKNFKHGDGMALDLKSYEALLKRGYTWQDKKNGLELLMSVDRKSTPMILSGKYLAAGESEIVRKGEIRDYARLLASTMGSYYSTREVGFVVLVKKDGKWVYGDPFLNETVKKDTDTADKKITRRQETMDDMISKGTIKVISTKDFMTYAKDKNYRHFFGETNAMDRARESLRSALYKPGMLYGELIYGAYNDRLDKMTKWYAAQWQVRQTLDRLAHTIKDERMDGGEAIKGMMSGTDRFKYDEKSMNRIYSNDALPEVTLGKGREKDDIAVRESLAKEMKRLNAGEGSFADSAKAWYHNWHGRMASNIVGELGREESNFFNARLEARALERIKGTLEKDDYIRLKGEISARNSEIKSEYKRAKDEYMDLNRDLIGWVGSKHMFTYAAHRTVFNLGLAGRLLDSRHVQGTQDAFYQITESSVMRDPRVAIGASAPGWEHSYYVGYHTGQNVYERSRYWATNSLWEQQMRFNTDLVYTVHKWWNDRMSFFARYTSGYPAPVKSDMMYAPTYQPRSTKDYFKALLWIMPFQSRSYSDYFRSRWQDAISFSGAGAMLASYQSLGTVGRYETPEEGQEKRSWLKRQIDKMGMESEHYGSPFRIASQQRYIDQVTKFDDYIDSPEGKKVNVKVDGVEMSLAAARDEMKHASANADLEREEKYAEGISDAIGAVANLKDRRGRYVRDVFSGSDIQDDGSRNRFLDMYIMFHSNSFQPTIPGMLHSSPIGKGEWYTFPQVAREVNNAADNTRLGAMKNYWQAGYDAEEGRITFKDQFTTRQDSVAEAYRNDVPVLMHLMKMQNKEIGYSLVNSPSLAYVNPIWFGLGRIVYKTAIHHTPGMEGFTSTFSEPDWTTYALGAIPGANSLRKYIKRRRGELPPRETLDGDIRHGIFGRPAHAIVSDAKNSSSLFSDLIYGGKFETAPGGQTTLKKHKEKQVQMLAGE